MFKKILKLGMVLTLVAAIIPNTAALAATQSTENADGTVTYDSITGETVKEGTLADEIDNEGLPILDSTFRSEPNSSEIAEMNKNGNFNLDGSMETPSFNSKMTMATNAAYFRVYGTPTLKTSIVQKFDLLGEVTAYNNTSSTAVLQYKQASRKETSWSVSLSVSGSTEVSAAFIAKASVEAGLSGTYNSVTEKSSEVLFEINVKAGKHGSIKAYKEGIYATGSIPWTDHLGSSTGTVVSSGTLSVFGTVVATNGFYFEGSEY